MDYWLGCLAPRERGAFELLRSYYVGGAGPIPESVYDFTWVALGGTVQSERYTIWTRRCGMTRVFVPDGDGGGEFFLEYNNAFWLQVLVASALPPVTDRPCYSRPRYAD